jgi:transcriptional regulator with XRE-family HTH domain
MILRNNMKNRRLQLGLTQEEVAERMKIERTSYTMYETGKRNPPLDKALKIKEILQADDSIFINEEDSEEMKKIG